MTLHLDRSAWKGVSLGEIAAPSKEKVDPSRVERYVAGEHMDTGDLKIHRWGDPSEVDLGPAFHRRFRAGQVLYGSRRTYLRKVAVADFDGVCANTTFVVETKDSSVLLQEFLPMVMSAEPFHAFAVAESKGSVNPYVNWSDIARYEFDLPPLDEQERIADLLWEIERHKRALTDRAITLSESGDRLLERRLEDMPTTVRLGALATTRSGPSFAASGVHDEPIDGSVPVIGIPNTRPDGTMHLGRVSYVTGLQSTVGRIDDRSLVLIRTNGNRDRIGNVYLPPPEAHGHAVSAFQFLMQANEPSEREYLYMVLSGKAMQERMSDGASGTVGLGNLAVRWLNEQAIPWSDDPTVRHDLVIAFRCFSEACAVAQSELDVLADLKASLLAEIFGDN